MKNSRIILSLAALLLSAVTVQAQTGTVKCTDGTSSKAGQGACSGHGGMAKADAKPPKVEQAGAAKATKADAKPAKADKAADAKPTKADKAADAKPAKADKAADAKPAKADAKLAKADKGADAKPAKADKAEGAPTATCTDGTKSYAKNHSGACSGHGGVKEWLDGTAKKP